MLNTLTGTITQITETEITLTAGAFGFAISVPSPSSYQEKQEILLHIYMHWNQENGPSLYGFAQSQEKEIFGIIIGCSGIGPRIGLAILADLGVSGVLNAVHQENEKALSGVNGIGPKKAEQLIVQLKHKVKKLLSSGAHLADDESMRQHWQQIHEVLSSLNYSRGEIARAMKHLEKENAGTNLPFDQLMRQALSFLAKSR